MLDPARSYMGINTANGSLLNIPAYSRHSALPPKAPTDAPFANTPDSLNLKIPERLFKIRHQFPRIVETDAEAEGLIAVQAFRQRAHDAA